MISTFDVHLQTEDGHNLKIFCALPDKPRKAAVVILSEIYGLTPYIKDVCEKYAKLGFPAFSPYLYNRLNGRNRFEYSEESEAHEASTKLLKIVDALTDINATIEIARKYGSTNVIGYSYGATLGWVAASQNQKIAYFCGLYGNRIALNLEKLPLGKFDVIFANQDLGLTPERLRLLKKSVPAKNLHFVDGKHGFDCHHRKADFSPELSSWAFELTLKAINGEL